MHFRAWRGPVPEHQSVGADTAELQSAAMFGAAGKHRDLMIRHDCEVGGGVEIVDAQRTGPGLESAHPGKSRAGG